MAIQQQSPRQPDNTDVEVGRLVRALRIARGLSQTQLGNRLGVTFQQVQNYEGGVNRISMGRLARIAQMFGVQVPYLLDGSKHLAPKWNQADGTEYAQVVGMLGGIGAQRLLRAFAALPPKPAKLRESIVQVVEGAAAAGHTGGVRKRTKRQ